jgi:hypothetical protein
LVDPKHPEAHRDPSLRRSIERRAQQGIAALIRFNERDAITLFAPAFADIARGEVRRRPSSNSLGQIEECWTGRSGSYGMGFK